jgi:hypothetical protein
MLECTGGSCWSQIAARNVLQTVDAYHGRCQGRFCSENDSNLYLRLQELTMREERIHLAERGVTSSKQL